MLRLVMQVEMFRRRGGMGEGGVGWGVRAKVQHLNTSAFPSLAGHLITNFAPCCGHMNLTVGLGPYYIFILQYR